MTTKITQIVTAHRNTDFDALASMIGATLLYPGTVPVLPREINPNVRAFMAIHKNHFAFVSPKNISYPDIQRLIVVDTNRWERLDPGVQLKNKENLDLLLWDHHQGNGNLPCIWRCVEQTGATISLMVRRMKQELTPISPIQATLFLTGIYEDTGNLTFPGTTHIDAYAAAYLLEKGADLSVISSILTTTYGETQKELLFRLLADAAVETVNGYTVSIRTTTVAGHVEMLSVVVHMYREIMNVDAAFGIFVTDDEKCMVIGRSRRDGPHIGALMRMIGGGGHPNAGSAMIKGAHINPDAVAGTIRELIAGDRKTTIRISDIMSFPVHTIAPAVSMKDARKQMDEKNCKGFPVLENDRIIGIVSNRDFTKIKRRKQWDDPVKAYMNREVVTVSPEQSPLTAAKMMVKHEIGHLPVMENDRLIGIITRSDAMFYFYDIIPE
jgi:nanoRNase/pAp phosphatase (c-di-AMP/oligoRNAs hydrolase)